VTLRSSRAWQIGSVLLAATLAPSGVASASLGDNASSVDRDRVHMQGALLRIVRADTHIVHEIRAASGTTVREYLTTTGTVFAVAWQGPWLPDMRQVLGTHFDQYQRAIQSGARTRKSRGSIVIDESDLVVQMSGHQRSFSGRAYVPALVPLGLRPDSIR
jgi:hypothetical protein